MYVNGNNRRASYNSIYFYSFGNEHFPKEIKQFMGNKNITNIYRLQVYDSIICRYSCIEFIDFMLKSKILVAYTNLLSPND